MDTKNTPLKGLHSDLNAESRTALDELFFEEDLSPSSESTQNLRTSGAGFDEASKFDSKTPVFDRYSSSIFSATPSPKGATGIPDLESKTDMPHSSVRSKSSQRLRYEAEVQLIKRKVGDLERVREVLGLTQRKMCQLLMVDPSAWTRWTKNGESAPPHIYRSLQWYLALQEKYPALDVNFWLSTVSRAGDVREAAQEAELMRLREEVQKLNATVDQLKRNTEMQKQHFLGFKRWAYLAVLSSLLLAGVLGILYLI